MAPTVLRADPTPLDESWDFRRIALPHARNRNMGKHISFKPQAITIDIAHFPDNRILRGDDPSKIILASFGEFRFPNTGPSVARDYMIRFFKAGLNLNDVHYRFYGHSNSQLRGRSCFLREARTDLELDQRISLLGDFDKLMNAAKRAKRIGLLFSAASIDWMLDEKFTEDIPDIVSGGELFSDGCGLISKRLAILVSRKKRIIFHSKNYTPCVYQIRYKGYKGVVMLHPDLDLKQEKLIQFRSSQKKFKAMRDDTFSVVDYSVPYAYHRLNDDIIVLLSSLGVTTEKFMAKQQAYFDWIVKAGTSWEVAFDFLTSLNKFDVAEKLLLEGIDCPEVKSKIQAGQNSEVASFQKKDKKDHFRTRMIIHKSRFLFGVCDPYQVLLEGEVHVRITVPRKGATTLTQTDLLVVRNPCLHPGDCLKLRAVAHPRLSHLVDCVVFSTVGRRAAPSMSSGGDLDGDRFFVMFDPDLMPTKVAESYNYPEGRAPPPRNVTRQDLAQHFSSYNSIDMARVAALHRKWVYASPDGAMCSQCQELNALYSSSVDGGKIKIPDRLKSPPGAEGPYVLDLLADAAKSFAANFLQLSREVDGAMNPVTAHDTIVRLLSTEKLAVSEYEVVTMALDLARRHSLDLRQYLSHVNFSALTTAQKHSLSVLLDLIPEEHPYVWNSMIRSDIITPQELRYRSLDGPLHLQRLYTSQIQGRPAFFEYLREANEDYIRKLIIIKTDDRFSIGIFMKGRQPWNEDGDIDNNVVICSFMPQSTDSGRSTYRPGTKGYKFYCDENIMQIFNRQRGDTFVFITRPPEKSGADIAASVALQKISKAVQQQCGRVQRAPVSAIEIHVISNRDRVAHQAFDLRFDHVQTEEYLGRFAHVPVPYTPHSLTGYHWENAVQEKRIIFTGTEDEAKRELAGISRDTLDSYMDFALQNRAEDQLFWMFKELLSREPLDHERIALRISRHPPLAYVVLKKFLSEDTSELPDEVLGLGPSIIRGIIRSANQLGIAALVALEKLSADICRLDIRQYFELLWLAAVSIRPQKLVQEVLIVLHDCCEPKRQGRDVLKYAHKHALAVVFDRAEEAADECPCDDAGRPTKQRAAPVRVKLVPVRPPPTDGAEEVQIDNPSVHKTDFRHVMAHVRVDAATTVRIHSHVRLQVASKAEHSTIERAVVDAIVIQASRGELRLELLHTLPPEFEVMDWNMYPAGSVATARAMLDAILRLAEEGSDCCRFHHIITRTKGTTVHEHPPADITLEDSSDNELSFLNQSQRQAVNSVVAENDRLALIWGPPGTGKTTVIVQILLRFLRDVSETSNPPKVLMTASTHNAVDNVLERFLTENEKAKILDHEHILRVATDPSKVAKAHQHFTVDARVGGSITENPRLIQKAEKRLKDARIIFTTCAGAGLGIMRKYDFEIVLIDEASQVTEPCALIPLVKGCKRAVLVGDHVQLRPTVKPMGKALEFDVSLLERLYNSSSYVDVSRAMLEVQYRFSDDIGRFPSTEFYNGRLRSGVQFTQLNQQDDVLRASSFPWPEGRSRLIPNVFVACGSEEDYGRSSKSNSGQVRLVKHIVALLQKNKTPSETKVKKEVPSIAVLTPYSRQLKQLREELSSEITTSTIDGFQGRESDIVIFSTVRCNAEGDIGFVEDARRLNVAWTRPRLALIIVGDKRTLEANSTLWMKAIKDCAYVEIPPPES